MTRETFVAQPGALPDYSVAHDWSGGAVPGLGATAVVDGTTVVIDPGKTLTAHIVLQTGAALVGNGGGFSLGEASAVSVEGANALYGNGAIANRGTVVLDVGTHLDVVVENGAIPAGYGLKLPSFQNAGQITVLNGATLSVEGTELSNTGAIAVSGGTLEVAGGAVDGGQAAPPVGGEIILEAGGAALFSDGVAAQRIDFNGAGSLSFGDVNDIKAVTISGFSTLDTILVPSVADGQTLLERLAFKDLPSHTAPEVVATGAGAELLLEAVPPCFARGSCLLTPLGYRAVETLAVGDPVVTVSGDIRAVRWIGCRTLDIAAHRRPEAVQPVRLLPGALSPGVPNRSLRLSPDHALLLRGVLVPVKLLVNGATILRERGCVAVTYFHVELDRHEVLLAENVAVESYIDTGNRSMFAQTSGTPRRDPVFGRGTQWDASAYAPLCLGGATLREIRQELHERACALGYAARTLTDIALWSGSGKLLRIGGTDAYPAFRLAGEGGRIAIRSPRFVPAEFTAGSSEDPADERLLGIALRGIQLDEAFLPVGRLAIAGFYPRAADDIADWTDGNAEIQVPDGIAMIGLDIAALPIGWLSPTGHPI